MQGVPYIAAIGLCQRGNMRNRAPLPVAEKNLKSLRDVLDQLPDSAHLTFVGDGPYRQELEEHFAGCRVTFTVRLVQGH